MLSGGGAWPALVHCCAELTPASHNAPFLGGVFPCLSSARGVKARAEVHERVCFQPRRPTSTAMSQMNLLQMKYLVLSLNSSSISAAHSILPIILEVSTQQALCIQSFHRATYYSFSAESTDGQTCFWCHAELVYRETSLRNHRQGMSLFPRCG